MELGGLLMIHGVEQNQASITVLKLRSAPRLMFSPVVSSAQLCLKPSTGAAVTLIMLLQPNGRTQRLEKSLSVRETSFSSLRAMNDELLHPSLSTQNFDLDGEATTSLSYYTITSTFELCMNDLSKTRQREESLEQGGFQSALGTKTVDYLEPSRVEEELEEGEDRNVQI